MNSQREATEEDLNEIREQLKTLETEIQEYRTQLDKYEKGDTELQAVIEWIDNTEILYRL